MKRQAQRLSCQPVTAGILPNAECNRFRYMMYGYAFIDARQL